MGLITSIILSLSILMGCFAVPASAEKRVALVIGNANYLHISRLKNTANDAMLVSDVLRSLGFDLVDGGPILNADKPAFDLAVQRFGRDLLGADVGLFYFAGHGVEVNDANFLIPVGADPVRTTDLDFQAVEARLVLRQMESAGTRLNLIILDACRNNPFAGRGLRSIGRGLARMESPLGTLISFAAQPGAVADDGSDGHSPYTRALADMVRRPGLDIFQVFNEVGLTVQRRTGGAQRPWLSISPISGKFYFSEPVQSPPLPPSVPPDEILWSSIKEFKSPETFEEFLRSFPDSKYASLARARLRELKADKTVVVSPAPVQPPPGIVRPPTSAKPAPATTRPTQVPPAVKQSAVPPATRAVPKGAGRCTTMQAQCSLEIGGCCDTATGRWQYGQNGCGGSTLAYNACISRKLAGRK